MIALLFKAFISDLASLEKRVLSKADLKIFSDLFGNLGKLTGAGKGSEKGVVLNVFKSFLINDFVPILDERQALESSQSKLARVSNKILSKYSDQDINREIVNYLFDQEKSQRILIQSAAFLSPAEKHHIRTNLKKKFPDKFVVFEINRDLLGGMRVYKQGKLLDASWLSQINELTKAKISK